MNGHVVRRGKYYSAVVELRDERGKRKAKWIALGVTGKREAEMKLRHLLTEAEQGGVIDPSRQTLGTYIEDWLRSVGQRVRRKTLFGYQGLMRRHIIPNLGSVPLRQLTPQHLSSLYSKLIAGGRLDGKEGGLSARTVGHIHRILKEALKQAVEWNMIPRNPADRVKPPRVEAEEVRMLSPEEVQQLRAVTRSSEIGPLVDLILATGLRRSEAMALRWRDVDLELMTVKVERGVHQLADGSIVFEAPKSRHGRRRVDLPPSAALALRRHKEYQMAQRLMLDNPMTSHTLVFSKPDDTLICLPDTLTHKVAKLAANAGLGHVTVHMLRHTHASLLMEQGVNIKVLQERLGHADVSTTLRVYAHLLPNAQREAADKFDALLTGDTFSQVRVANG